MPYPSINDREFNLLKKITENTADIAAGGGGGGGSVSSVFGRSGAVVAANNDYTKAQVGLSNVDNTSDANKPVSTAQATANALVATNAATDATTKANAAAAASVPVAFQALIPDAGGWIAGEAWTYVSATTFTVASDVTARYAKGDRIKLTQTTVKYFYVTNVSAFGSGVTTITVNGGSDYTLANAAITSPLFSKESTPNGFPQWFNWTPTLTGFGAAADPTNTVYRFNIVGRMINLMIRQGTAGTSNATTFTISLPVTAATITNMAWTGVTGVVDAGVLAANAGVLSIASAATTVGVFRDQTSTAFTASGIKRATTGFISYEF